MFSIYVINNNNSNYRPTDITDVRCLGNHPNPESPLAEPLIPTRLTLPERLVEK